MGIPKSRSTGRIWQYQKEGQLCDSVGEGQLLALLKGGEVNTDTLVKTGGMMEWLPIKDVPALVNPSAPLQSTPGTLGRYNIQPLPMSKDSVGTAPGKGVLCPQCGGSSRKLRLIYEEGSSTTARMSGGGSIVSSAAHQAAPPDRQGGALHVLGVIVGISSFGGCAIDGGAGWLVFLGLFALGIVLVSMQTTKNKAGGAAERYEKTFACTSCGHRFLRG